MQTLVNKVLSYAKSTPQKEALITPTGICTYHQLSSLIEKASDDMIRRGVVKGDRVMVAADQSIDYVSTYLSLHNIGAVAIPFNSNSTDYQLQQLTDYLCPKIVYIDSQNILSPQIPNPDESCAEIDSDDTLADIVFTSGTTGIPKGVVLTHTNLVAACGNVINGGSITNEDIALLPAPLYHQYGLATLRSMLYSGATIILQPGISSLKMTYDNINTYKPTHVSITPTMLTILKAQCGGGISNLLQGIKKLEFGSSPLKENVRKELLNQLNNVTIINTYGATEASRSTYLTIDDSFAGLNSIGHASINAIIDIVDTETGNVITTPNTIGEIVIKGPMISPGYFRQSSDRIINNEYHTHDLGYKDSLGYIYMSGRQDDLINKGGEKVYPEEIEKVALDSKLINECAVVGVKDATNPLSEIVALFLVGDVSSKKDLECYLASHLDKYKIPDKIVYVDNIPKNELGKIDRSSMRKHIEEQMGF
jgi:long-chain acyl-CoA synthetase